MLYGGKMKYDLEKMATFGVAGNFTGHLEQAHEALDFVNVQVKEQNAPKAIFPTYLPETNKSNKTPDFLHTFPFDSQKIVYPENEQRIQIEPECALVFKTEWDNGILKNLKPVCFGASNDCSIRKEGAKKISQKKNWGKSSKGFSDTIIECSDFTEDSLINDYRIASFLVRDGKAFDYGEDSAVRDYSYIYKKLIDWMIEKFNFQKDEGPAEALNVYLSESEYPDYLMVSIGATRYTDFGEHNFLQKNDFSVVIVYPESKYTHEQILNIARETDNQKIPSDISALFQRVI